MYFFHNFKELFAPRDLDTNLIGDWSELFRLRRVFDSDRLNLSALFSMEEIRVRLSN